MGAGSVGKGPPRGEVVVGERPGPGDDEGADDGERLGDDEGAEGDGDGLKVGCGVGGNEGETNVDA